MKAGRETEYYVGIDISKEQPDVYIRPSDEYERYRNDREGASNC